MTASFTVQIVPVTPFQQNCTLLWCTETNKGALVDPGGDLPKLREAIRQTGVEIEKILVTDGRVRSGPSMMPARMLITSGSSAFVMNSGEPQCLQNTRCVQSHASTTSGSTRSLGTSST